MSLDFIQKALQSKNVLAFLVMIRKSEGTDAPDGYHYLFGSSPHNTLRFADLSKHPNIKQPYGKTFSTAAGAFQLLFATWEAKRKKYNLPDFSEHSQNIAATDLISDENALQLVIDGHFEKGLHNCGSIWASLPDNTYGQPKHPEANYLAWYASAGGLAVL